MKTIIPERNYTSMSAELENLQNEFAKQKISENEFNGKRDALLQEMHDYKYKKKGSKQIMKGMEKNILLALGYTVSIILLVIGLILAILPLVEFSFIPLAGSLIVSLIIFFITKKTFAKYLIFITIGIALFSVGKIVLSKDEVAKDKQFEQSVKESQKEDLKDLEGLN